jgi:ketosteroid isomerase-like protein
MTIPGRGTAPLESTPAASPQRTPTACAILAAVTLLLCAPAGAQERRELPPLQTYGTPAAGARDDAVPAFIERYTDAWARQDVDAFVALHADDTEWINAYARLVRGAGPLGDFLRNRLFPAFDPAVSAREAAGMRTLSIRHLGSAAVVHLYTEADRGSSRNADEERRRTHIHLVLAAPEGAWRVVHTAIMDAR